MTSKLTRKDMASLRQLAEQAWLAELSTELTKLQEAFGRWTDKRISAFDLSERIHEFHDGPSRELYRRYTALDPATAVARALALGILGEPALDVALLAKLAPYKGVFGRDQCD